MQESMPRYLRRPRISLSIGLGVVWVIEQECSENWGTVLAEKSFGTVWEDEEEIKSSDFRSCRGKQELQEFGKLLSI